MCRHNGLRSVALALLPLLAWHRDGWAQTPADAQGLQAQGDWRGAEAVWRKLLSSEPGDYRLWASLGIVLAHQGRYDEAIVDYKKALSLHGEDPQTQLNLGIAYFKSGRLGQAVKPLEAAYKRGGPTFQTELLLGTSLYGSGQYRAAIPYLERAAAEQPNNTELAHTLGEAYLYAAQYDKAMSVFQQMLTREPDSPAVHVLLGEAYDAANREEAAIAEFREAAKGGYLPNAHFGLGYLLWKAHSYDEASPEFEKELQHDARHAGALAYLGDIELKRGNKQKAEDLLRRSLAARNDGRVALLDLGIIETEKGEYSAAERDLRRAAGLDSNEADVHYRLAKLYQLTNRKEQAAKEYALVKKVHRNDTYDLVFKVSGKDAGAAPEEK
jgi:Flp pilus assembly protein TadD